MLLPFMMSCEGHKHKPNSIGAGRCVVTGNNSGGKSSILRDGPGLEDVTVSGPKSKSMFLWIEDQVPVHLDNSSNPLRKTDINFLPPSGGLSARIITWEPGSYADYHQTDTIDLIFIISDGLELMLDEGSTVLNAGETVIQRGTNHAWRVYGEEPCTFVAIMISAVKILRVCNARSSA
jgi:quercetin dioxygenase-like cupin family protein